MQKRFIPYILLVSVVFLLIPAVYADEASEWYVKGQNAAIVGDYETALQYYNNALAADKNYISANSGKAVALNKLGRYEESVAAADIVLASKKEPNAAEARAFALLSLGRYEESVAAYDLFFTVRQNVPEAYCNQGRAYVQLNETEEAIASFDHCVKLDPANLDGWNQKGLVLLSLGRYQDAVDAFNHCTRITLTNATIWNNKGLAYAGIEDYEKAMSCFKTALNLDPGFEEARINLEKAYRREPFFASRIPSTTVTTPPVPVTTTRTVPPVTTSVIPTVVQVQQETGEQTTETRTTYAPLSVIVPVTGLLIGIGIFLAKDRKNK